jgi:L,D-transpeptidase ErfK/SrfK
MPVRGMCLVLAVITSLIFSSPAAFARSYGQSLCQYQGFHCVRVKRGQSWSSLFPDEQDRDIVMRINRMNTQIWSGMVIAVPDQLESADVMDFAPFPRKVDPLGEKVIVVDPMVLAWGAYDDDGRLVRWGPIAAGSDYCRDLGKPCHTRAGSFRIFSLGSSECISHKFPLPYGGAPMPYCMYFNNGQALHGEPNGVPGHNASHGCVRLYVNDAEWLRYEFVEGPNPSNDYRGTRVIVRPYKNDTNDSNDKNNNNKKKNKKSHRYEDDEDTNDDNGE